MSATPQTEAQRLADQTEQKFLADIEKKRVQLDEAVCRLTSFKSDYEALYNSYRAYRDTVVAVLKERDQLRAQLALAVAKEREECAKVCEQQADRFMQASPLEGNKPYASHECAAAIRARGAAAPYES